MTNNLSRFSQILETFQQTYEKQTGYKVQNPLHLIIPSVALMLFEKLDELIGEIRALRQTQTRDLDH